MDEGICKSRWAEKGDEVGMKLRVCIDESYSFECLDVLQMNIDHGDGTDVFGKPVERFTVTFDSAEGFVLVKGCEPTKAKPLPIAAWRQDTTGRIYGYCPTCGIGLDNYKNNGKHITRFCYNCGQAVKWE